LGRMLITGKISEETFDHFRLEWQEKIRNAELSLAEMERETKFFLDKLDLALALLTKIAVLYPQLRLKDKVKKLGACQVSIVNTSADDPGEKARFYLTTRLQDNLEQVVQTMALR
jgi:hypothetical protein